MIRTIAAVAALLLSTSPAWAQDKAQGEAKKGAPAVEKKSPQAKGPPTEARKRQQERMRECNEQAGARKLEGEARKKFMSACLRGMDPEKAERKAAQREKMRSCNRQASEKGLKGEERKRFMSECLRS